jgi:hypothetical protein
MKTFGVVGEENKKSIRKKMPKIRNLLNYIHIMALKDIYGGLDHRWGYIFFFQGKRSLFKVSLRGKNGMEIETKMMLAISEFVSRQKAVFISIQYISNIYSAFV